MRIKNLIIIGVWALLISSPIAFSHEGPQTQQRIPWNIFKVAVNDNYAYCVSDSCLIIVDIDNPSSPYFAGYLDLPAAQMSIAGDSDIVYLAGGDLGVLSFNVADPSRAYLAAFYDTPGKADNAFVDGFFLYATDEDGGLNIFNIAKSDSIILADNFYTTDCNYIDLFIDGNRAYIIDVNTGLRILDIADPLNPKPLGVLNFTYIPKSIFVDDSFVFLANGGNGLEIIDARSGNNPRFVCEFDTPGYACKAVVYDESAYVADGTGLVIIDVTNPETPIITGSLELSGWAHDICVDGNYAYIAASDSGLQIVNISDDNNPTLVGRY
jgi:hypothetical protein